MLRYRSFLALVLALVTVFVVSCATLTAQPPLYDQSKLAQVKIFLPTILATRDRMPELEKLIEERDWVFVGNFIHGPLGDLRREMKSLARNLLPPDDKAATKAADRLFNDIEAIDAAAEANSYAQAAVSYKAAIKDFDSFLDLIPTKG
ncbi:MAG: photosystem II protein PsbQ [Hormoscilla sp. SP5CHS1]|nr:photosystem II protein PsbQ [Hormoscilla sp. SP12CHS1]MBC6455502.1 photosystem II protein PsbQ [Hormoscilla sp. SP5CHS1]